MSDDNNVVQMPGVHVPVPAQIPPPAVPPVGKAPQTRAGRLSKAQKRSRILAMRASGATVEKIAEALAAQGFPTTAHGVSRVLNNALAEMASADEQVVDKVRAMQVERLDTALRAIWPRVRDGDLKAIDRMLQIERTRARIMGTEAPTQVQVDGQVTHRLTKDEVDHEKELWLQAGGEQTSYDVDGTASELPALGA